MSVIFTYNVVLFTTAHSEKLFPIGDGVRLESTWLVSH
jgi:hypothetical protein